MIQIGVLYNNVMIVLSVLGTKVHNYIDKLNLFQCGPTNRRDLLGKSWVVGVMHYRGFQVACHQSYVCTLKP